jgi:hypothetical protein
MGAVKWNWHFGENDDAHQYVLSWEMTPARFRHGGGYSID